MKVVDLQGAPEVPGTKKHKLYSSSAVILRIISNLSPASAPLYRDLSMNAA